MFYKYLFKLLISFSLVTAADEHNDRINNPVLFKKNPSEPADRSSLTPTFHNLTCISIIYKPVESTTLDELRGYIADLRYYWTHTNTHVNSKWVSDRTRVNYFILKDKHQTWNSQNQTSTNHPSSFEALLCFCVTGGQWRQQRCALVSKVAWNERVFSTSLTGKQLKRSNECRVDGSRPRTAPSGGGSGQRPSQGQVHTVMEAVLFVKGMEQKEAQTAFTGQRAAAAAAATSSSQF